MKFKAEIKSSNRNVDLVTATQTHLTTGQLENLWCIVLVFFSPSLVLTGIIYILKKECIEKSLFAMRNKGLVI